MVQPTGVTIPEEVANKPLTKRDGIMICGLIKKFVMIMTQPGDEATIMLQNINQIEKRILGS